VLFRFESDYAHYPQPEEYLGELSGRQQQQQFSLAYLTNNGDQYAIPVKLRSQLEYQSQSKRRIYFSSQVLFRGKSLGIVTMYYQH
jgi:hypothetical protein